MAAKTSAARGLIVSAFSSAGTPSARLYFLQEQDAGLVLGRPEVLVVLDGVGVDVGEDELELIGQVVHAGVLGPGQADQQQLIGVLDVVVGVAAFGVGADKPALLGIGFLEVAPALRDLSQDPAGEEGILAGHACRGRLLGLIPAAAQEQQLGPPRLQRRRLGIFPGRVVDDGEGLVVFPLALQGEADSNGGGRLIFRVPGQLFVLFPGLVVVAGQPELAGFLEGRLGRRHGGENGEHEGRAQVVLHTEQPWSAMDLGMSLT